MTPSFYPAERYGGPIVTTRCLTTALVGEGHEVMVVTTDADGTWDVVDCERAGAEDAPYGARIVRCRRNLPPDVSASLVREVFDWTTWADVVHVTAAYSFPTVPALFACKSLRRPCVWSPHGAFQSIERGATRRLKRLWRSGMRAILPKACVLHATSSEEAEKSRIRFPGLPIVVVPNGVEVPRTARCRKASTGCDVLFLGRIEPIKRLDLLLKAVALERAAGRDIRLSVAGDGAPSLLESLKTLASRVGVADATRWHGHVTGEERERRFAEADVLALVSDSENFGMVVAEALARGVPVVTTTGTPWRNVEKKGCGLCVNPDAESIAGALNRIRLTGGAEMGARGRAWMMEEFGWQGRAAQMARVYESLCTGNSTGDSSSGRQGI